MAETYSQYRSYKPGDVIRLILRLEDPSGVNGVQAFFVLTTDTTKQLVLLGDGQGHQSVEVVLQETVTQGTAPGDYYCFQVDVSDMLGN